MLSIIQIEAVNLSPGKVTVKITNHNSFLDLATFETRWSLSDSDGALVQSGLLSSILCAPEKTCVIKIPIEKNLPNKSNDRELWLHVSFHTKADLLWANAGYEIAAQQFKLALDKKPVRQKNLLLNAPVRVIKTSDTVIFSGSNAVCAFSRKLGSLISLKFDGREMLATNLLFPTLQLFRAPTDNDKGFGKWLARDWREAGLTNLVRHVEYFTVTQTTSGAAKIITTATSRATNGGYSLQTTWTFSPDGTLEMDNEFKPFGELPWLPRVGILLALAKDFENVRWLGRGPWENYSDRKESAEVGVWQSTATKQYVPYVRPQETGNKEDVRWVNLTDADGAGLRMAGNTNLFAFSALHFTANDLAAARHNYELKPRPEIVLSLDAKMSGLGNSSCGPGVLEKYSVPPTNYFLHLKFSPVNADDH